LGQDRDSNASFLAEVERLRAAGVVGQSGRLRELFDFLAERGPNAQSASQAEIAESVFGQVETDADDATVRVYVHRLRKKIDDYYVANPGGEGAAIIELPAGVYALRLVTPEIAHPEAAARTALAPGKPASIAILSAIAGMAIMFGLFTWLNGRGANPIWDPLLDSDRPVLIVLGDYYLFGEIDPVRPDEGRLIRDFRVDSAEDLLRMQEAEPERYGFAEDVGLNYLPFQSAFALERIAPILAGEDKQVEIIATSELTSQMLVDNDVVYIGLLSGMGLLEEVTFAGSGLRIGNSYDEIEDRESGQLWASDEARRLASPAFYRDYAYVSQYRAPGDALVTVIASERVTGLRGIGDIVTEEELPEGLADIADGDAFEALFQITGQQGADLNDRLILARSRE